MRAMAFLAGRGIRIALAVQLSMDAGNVLLANFIVASGAVNRVDDRLARPHTGGVDLRVALAAGNVPKPAGFLTVARMVHLGAVDVHGFSVARATQLLVGVATHAVRIGHTLRIEDVPDLMRLMAVRAGGQDVGLFFPEFSAN